MSNEIKQGNVGLTLIRQLGVTERTKLYPGEIVRILKHVERKTKRFCT